MLRVSNSDFKKINIDGRYFETIKIDSNYYVTVSSLIDNISISDYLSIHIKEYDFLEVERGSLKMQQLLVSLSIKVAGLSSKEYDQLNSMCDSMKMIDHTTNIVQRSASRKAIKDRINTVKSPTSAYKITTCNDASTMFYQVLSASTNDTNDQNTLAIITHQIIIDNNGCAVISRQMGMSLYAPSERVEIAKKLTVGRIVREFDFESGKTFVAVITNVLTGSMLDLLPDKVFETQIIEYGKLLADKNLLSAVINFAALNNDFEEGEPSYD